LLLAFPRLLCTRFMDGLGIQNLREEELH